MKKTRNFTVAPGDEGRLDRTLANLFTDCSRTYLQNLIKSGNVHVDGITVTQSRFAVREGMLISVDLPDTREITAIEAEPFGFDILFEDNSFLVINKPAGVVVHPAPGNQSGTVVNALLCRYPAMMEEFSDPENLSRPGIIHRLDKDTSGCLAIAKTAEAKFKLGTAFADRKTQKTYLAICRGIPQQQCGEIKNLIGRHPVNRQKMAIVTRNGKEAHSSYRVLAHRMIDRIPLTLAEIKIFTGRTHQIRVHLSSIGLPIVGDDVYGRATFPGVERQLLHAWKLTLPHPVSGETMTFTAPLPDDFCRIKQLLEN